MTRRRAFALIVPVLFVGALVALPGCYTRVTKAKGIGADAQYPDRYQSSEPLIDKWIDSKTDQN